MRIEKMTDTDYKISLFFNIDSSFVKEEIEKIIIKLKESLKLNGFYKVIISIRKFGIFLILNKVDDSYYKDTLNIRFIDKSNFNIYFKTEDYFLIRERKEILYYDGYYYLLVDDTIIDNNIGLVDFGNFVFGDDIEKALTNAVVV